MGRATNVYIRGVKISRGDKFSRYTGLGGQGRVDASGELVLLPGSILHLDCLFPRLHGNLLDVNLELPAVPDRWVTIGSPTKGK